MFGSNIQVANVISNIEGLYPKLVYMSVTIIHNSEGPAIQDGCGTHLNTSTLCEWIYENR